MAFLAADASVPDSAMRLAGNVIEMREDEGDFKK
jgi:hypothetical protein